MEAENILSAHYVETTPERPGGRNGHRERLSEIRAASLDAVIPKLRTVSDLPRLREPRRPAECESFLARQSTRSVVPSRQPSTIGYCEDMSSVTDTSRCDPRPPLCRCAVTLRMNEMLPSGIVS